MVEQAKVSGAEKREEDVRQSDHAIVDEPGPLVVGPEFSVGAPVDLLTLQRTAGNAAVGRLLARASMGGGGPPEDGRDDVDLGPRVLVRSRVGRRGADQRSLLARDPQRLGPSLSQPRFRGERRAKALLARDKENGAGGGPPAKDGSEGAGQGDTRIEDITLFDRRSENKTWKAPMKSITFFEKKIVIPVIKFPVKITVGAQPSFETVLDAGVGPGVLRDNRVGIDGDSAKAAGRLHIPADSSVRADATSALEVRAEPAGESDELRAEASGSGGLNLIATAEARPELSAPVEFRLEGKSVYIDAEGQLRFEFKLAYSLGAVLTASIVVEEKKKGSGSTPDKPGAPGSLPPTRPPRPSDAPPIQLPDWLDRALPPKDMTPRGGRYVWRNRWDLKSEEREWILGASVKISAAGGPATVAFDPGGSPPEPDLLELAKSAKETEDEGGPEASQEPAVDVNAVKAAAHEANQARFDVQQAIWDKEANLEDEAAPPIFLPPNMPLLEPEGYEQPSPEETHEMLASLKPIEAAAAALDERYMAALELASAEDADLTRIAEVEFQAISDEAAILSTQLDEAVGVKKKKSDGGEGPTDPRYTKYATPDGNLIPPYSEDQRYYFYPHDYYPDIKSWMEDKVQDMTMNQVESGQPPRKPSFPGDWWFSQVEGLWLDRDVDNQIPTIDHRPPVWSHWNRGGNATDQERRREWYNGDGSPDSKLIVISKHKNSSLGSADSWKMFKVVKPTFRGP